MRERDFGTTGVAVPVIGQGTWNFERDDRGAAVEALRRGIDAGMTHVDTAEMYGSGRSEELVGEAIAGRREQVFLVSKVLPSNASYEGTLRACERSLKKLNTDYLDLYLLHWRGGYPLKQTMRAMEELAEDGSIRYIGVSNFDVADVREAQAALTTHRLAANQVLYHLGDRGIERKLIPYCRAHEIAVVGYSPFGHGDFPTSGSREAQALVEAGRRGGHTARQVALNFLTRQPGVFTIPKASRVEHVRENSGGAGWGLTPEEEAAVDRVFPAPTRDVPLGML
jgi:diketogulonate reductase-like aldo/keto reductase